MVTNVSAYPYNLTELQNSEGIYDIVNFANQSSGYVLINFFLFAMFIVMILALKRYSFHKALIASSFVMLILSCIFAFVGWCSYTIPAIFLGIMAFSAFIAAITGSFRQ